MTLERTLPAASRNLANFELLKPSECEISCTAVATCAQNNDSRDRESWRTGPEAGPAAGLFASCMPGSHSLMREILSRRQRRGAAECGIRAVTMLGKSPEAVEIWLGLRRRHADGRLGVGRGRAGAGNSNCCWLGVHSPKIGLAGDWSVVLVGAAAHRPGDRAALRWAHRDVSAATRAWAACGTRAPASRRRAYTRARSKR